MNLIIKPFILFYFLRSFFKRKIFIENISPTDLVLDVGSGDKPFWRADVIVDKYLNDNQQRATGSVMYDKNKLFLAADIENLPFRDKAFNFVFCSHVLEHVENPDKAISEIVRVAKTGYIEVPNGMMDLIIPFSSHLWYCDYSEGTLIFKQKNKVIDYEHSSIAKFGGILSKHILFNYLLAKNNSSFVISLYWKNKVKYRVIREKNTPYVYSSESHSHQESTNTSYFFYRLIYLLMTTLFYKKKQINLNYLKKK